MKDFCKPFDELCNQCWEDGYACCTVNIGTQEYYKGFQIYDTIQIHQSNHYITVDTDIEVLYKTEFPGGYSAGKMYEFSREQDAKERLIREYLEPKLPKGASLSRFHLHYNPGAHDPKTVALHIHVFKRVEDLQEARSTTWELLEAIKPKEINKIL